MKLSGLFSFPPPQLLCLSISLALSCKECEECREERVDAAPLPYSNPVHFMMGFCCLQPRCTMPVTKCVGMRGLRTDFFLSRCKSDQILTTKKYFELSPIFFPLPMFLSHIILTSSHFLSRYSHTDSAGRRGAHDHATGPRGGAERPRVPPLSLAPPACARAQRVQRCAAPRGALPSPVCG